MRKQGICLAVFLALYQVLGTGAHRAVAAEEAANAAIGSAPAGQTSGVSDSMAHQAATEAAQDAGRAGGQNAAAGTEAPSAVPKDALPENDVMGQGAGQSKDESLLPEENMNDNETLFGMRRGVVHPYVAVGAEYTDNLYNLDKQRVNNLLIDVNPGIWLSLPGKKQLPVTLAPNNASTGGYQYEMERYERTDRFQLFLLGDLDYKMYSEDSNLNEMLYRLQGFARYNFPAGLSLQILDAYTHNQDRYDVGFPDSQLTHVFNSNSLMGTIDWLITEKFQLRGDLSFFTLNYDEAAFSYLERDDIAFDLHFFFHATDKTAFFLEYRYIDTQYDSNTDYNSNSNDYYFGMTWDSTEKLSFLARVGLRQKSYDNSQFSDWDGFIFELQTVYRMTEKSKLTFDLYRQDEETDMIEAEDKVMLGASLGYNWDITDKISFGISGRYENADYRTRNGFSYVDSNGNVEYSRKDDRFIISPRLDYLFTEWLKAGIGYRYERRDSNIDLYDYYSNTIFVDAKVAF